MSATLGRLLQLIALIILPIGLSYGLFRNDVRMEVKLLFVGAFVYLLGWILAKKS